METPETLAHAGAPLIAELATPEVRAAIARTPSLGWYRQALVGMAQAEQAQMFAEVEQVCAENRAIENTQEFKAVNGLGYPYYRCPLSVRLRFEDLYGIGCWQHNDFVEDFLKHHPGLRLKVTRGTRGQQYGRVLAPRNVRETAGPVRTTDVVIPSGVEGSRGESFKVVPRDPSTAPEGSARDDLSGGCDGAQGEPATGVIDLSLHETAPPDSPPAESDEDIPTEGEVYLHQRQREADFLTYG